MPVNDHSEIKVLYSTFARKCEKSSQDQWRFQVSWGLHVPQLPTIRSMEQYLKWVDGLWNGRREVFDNSSLQRKASPLLHLIACILRENVKPLDLTFSKIDLHTWWSQFRGVSFPDSEEGSRNRRTFGCCIVQFPGFAKGQMLNFWRNL